MSEHDVAVIGAGPAGIATAVSLQERGVRPLVIDRASQMVASWRARYDRLKLNTGRQFSHLPGRRYPKGTPIFPTRDQVIEHFEGHVGWDRPAAPGLWFIGFSRRPALIGYMGKQSRRLAKKIANT